MSTTSKVRPRSMRAHVADDVLALRIQRAAHGQHLGRQIGERQREVRLQMPREAAAASAEFEQRAAAARRRCRAAPAADRRLPPRTPRRARAAATTRPDRIHAEGARTWRDCVTRRPETGCDPGVSRGRAGDVIGLPIGTDPEVRRARLDEATLGVEGVGPRIALPHAQPDGAAAERPHRVQARVHERRGDATAVPATVDVEAMELDRRRGRDARRRTLAPHLRERHQHAADRREQRHVVGIRRSRPSAAPRRRPSPGARPCLRAGCRRAKVSSKVCAASAATAAASSVAARRITTALDARQPRGPGAPSAIATSAAARWTSRPAWSTRWPS